MVSVLLLPLLTNRLTKYDFGLVQLLSSYSRILVFIIGLGGGAFLTNKLYSDRKFFVENCFGYYIYTFGLCIFITVLSLPFKDLLVDTQVSYCLFVLLFLWSYIVIIYEFNITIITYEKILNWYFIISIGKIIIEVLLVIILIEYLELSWTGRILSLFFGLLFSFVTSTYVLYKGGYFKLKISISKYLLMLVRSYPLLLFNLSIVVFTASDRIFIENILGTEQNGIYGVAYAFASIYLIIIGALNNVVRPMIYKDIKDNVYFNRKLIIFFITMLLVLFVFIFISKSIFFDLFINKKFHGAQPYVFAIMVGFFVWGVYNYFISYVLYQLDDNQIIIVSVTGIAFTFLLNYFFIVRFDIMGIAYSSIISNLILLAVTLYFAYINKHKAREVGGIER